MEMRFEDREVWRGVIILHGVADRDPEELVCQLFPNSNDGREQMSMFVAALPGFYNTMVVHNIDYRDIAIGEITFDPFVFDCSA